jgi:hypothetical protein
LAFALGFGSGSALGSMTVVSCVQLSNWNPDLCPQSKWAVREMQLESHYRKIRQAVRKLALSPDSEIPARPRKCNPLHIIGNRNELRLVPNLGGNGSWLGIYGFGGVKRQQNRQKISCQFFVLSSQLKA